jgi:hypothetical protein
MGKKALLSDRMSGRTAVVEIEEVGKVTVRGLSRYEITTMGKRDGTENQEKYLLAMAVLDVDGEGTLTEDEIEAWQKGSPPSEINEVLSKVMELSGIGEGAGKS